jgi:hypothetical protein
MSQPAANVDSIIFTWGEEEKAQDFSLSLWQRDCFSAAFTAEAEKAMFLSQSVPVIIAAKMTASLQLTDTDFPKCFKDACRQQMDVLREQHDKHSGMGGLREVFAPGPLEIMKTVSAAHNHMLEKNYEDEWVLRGLRRNYMLSYRPDLKAQRLVPVTQNSEQAWAEDMPEGSDRLKTSWSEGRLQWVDGSGKPQALDWKLCAAGRDISDLLEWSYCNQSEKYDAASSEDVFMEVQALADDFAIELETAALLQMHPELRQLAQRRERDQGGSWLRRL